MTDKSFIKTVKRLFVKARFWRGINQINSLVWFTEATISALNGILGAIVVKNFQDSFSFLLIKSRSSQTSESYPCCFTPSHNWGERRLSLAIVIIVLLEIKVWHFWARPRPVLLRKKLKNLSIVIWLTGELFWLTFVPSLLFISLSAFRMVALNVLL